MQLWMMELSVAFCDFHDLLFVAQTCSQLATVAARAAQRALPLSDANVLACLAWSEGDVRRQDQCVEHLQHWVRQRHSPSEKLVAQLTLYASGQLEAQLYTDDMQWNHLRTDWLRAQWRPFQRLERRLAKEPDFWPREPASGPLALLHVGDLCEARDLRSTFRPACVLFRAYSWVFVHFVGRAHAEDCWRSLDEVAPRGTRRLRTFSNPQHYVFELIDVHINI